MSTHSLTHLAVCDPRLTDIVLRDPMYSHGKIIKIICTNRKVFSDRKHVLNITAPLIFVQQ